MRTAGREEKGLAHLVAAASEGVGGLEEAAAAQRAATASRRPPLELPRERHGLRVAFQPRPKVRAAGFTSAARWLRRQRLSLGRSTVARSGAVDESKEAWSRVFFFLENCILALTIYK